jgi:hypothetical protein
VDNYYWTTEQPHGNNATTMCDFIENHNSWLQISFVDGSYAEGTDSNDALWAIHAGGNGNFNDHFVRFEMLNE